MSFNKVNNPTDKVVKLLYKGTNYSIGPKENKEFPSDVARHWITIFQFMSISPTTKETETKEEVIEEVKVEEKVEKEDKVKKVTKKVAKKK